MKILDMTAGHRAIWFDRKHLSAVFVDIRAEVEPDWVADSGALPFDDTDFNLVVFDPPHCNTGPNSHMTADYGHHTAAEIRTFVQRAAQEAHRVTVPDALMAFKWATHDQKLETVLALMAPWWEPLFGTVTTQSVRRRVNYWVMLRRRAKHAFPWEQA